MRSGKIVVCILAVCALVLACERRVNISTNDRDAAFVKAKVPFLSSSSLRVDRVTIDDFKDLGIYGSFVIDRAHIPMLFPVPEYSWFDGLQDPELWKDHRSAFGSSRLPRGNVKTAIKDTKSGKLWVVIVDNDATTSPTGLFQYWEF